MKSFKAALFDLDGVVFDTEPQYTMFWGNQFHKYYPEAKGLEQQIKGQTLVQIYERYFKGRQQVQSDITKELDEFELNMSFEYIDGLVGFLESLRSNNIHTAIVTSSNNAKMQTVYKKCPSIRTFFDEILTSEDFTQSKPSPECYLKAASRFGANPSECVVFEDSFNGLKSGRAAEMYVVGLATTNDMESIRPYSDSVISDYKGLNYEKICALMAPSH